MATQAHCAFCFEVLAAKFEKRQPLSLTQVEELWEEYQVSHQPTPAAKHKTESNDDDHQDTEGGAELQQEEDTAPRPAAISRLLNRDSGDRATSSASSTSSRDASNASSGTATPASTASSATTASAGSSTAAQRKRREATPLFVTWNTVSRGGHKSLRGCIGTFEPLELEEGLRSYALTSAFEDTRFNPIPASALPTLSNHVTLLTNFSNPTKDPLDWTLGTHGIRISFTGHNRRYGGTYLPDVAKEQGWTKEETLVSLMRKAGWSGSSRDWSRVWKEGKGELIRYEGAAVGLDYEEWRDWRLWVERRT